MYFLEDKMYIKNKRGDHIGTVISFVLFMTFVVFLYSITSPALKSSDEEENLLVYLENKIIENISDYLTSISVSFSPSGNCLQVNNYPYASNVLVKNSEGEIVNSDVLSGNLYIELNSESFFNIYASESFLNSPEWDSSSCNPSANYNLGLYRTEEKVSEEKVSELLKVYSENYDRVKEYFKVPDSREFGFGFIYNNNTLVSTDDKNVSTNIYTNKIPVEYFNEEAEILQGFVNIKVW